MKNDFATPAYSGAYPQGHAVRTPITVLRRIGGTWNNIETTLLRTHLNTAVIGHPGHREYLLIRGHFEKHHTLPQMMRDASYTVEKLNGLHDERLPFTPGWF